MVTRYLTATVGGARWQYDVTSPASDMGLKTHSSRSVIGNCGQAIKKWELDTNAA